MATDPTNLLGVASSKVDSTANAISSAVWNRRSWKRAQEWRDQDRQWAQEDYEKELADQRALRDEEREYYTPEALRARGINPALATGGASVQGSSSPSAPDTKGSEGQPSEVNPPQLNTDVAGSLNLMADTAQKQANTESIRTNTESQRIQNMVAQATALNDIQNSATSVLQGHATLKSSLQALDINERRIFIEEAQLDIDAETLQMNWKKFFNDVRLTDHNIATDKERLDLDWERFFQDARESSSRISLNSSREDAERYALSVQKALDSYASHQAKSDSGYAHLSDDFLKDILPQSFSQEQFRQAKELFEMQLREEGRRDRTERKSVDDTFVSNLVRLVTAGAVGTALGRSGAKSGSSHGFDTPYR